MYLPIFQKITITNKLGAKRIKDELEYAVDEIKLQDCSKLDPLIIKQFEESAEDLIHERCMPLL